MGDSSGGFIGLLNPEHLEKGDQNRWKRNKRGADILENGIKYMDFQPWEGEKGKVELKLKESLRIYSEMGKEIEQITKKEPKEYHLYVIGLLIDIISSLPNHIDVHISKNQNESDLS